MAPSRGALPVKISAVPNGVIQKTSAQSFMRKDLTALKIWRNMHQNDPQNNPQWFPAEKFKQGKVF